MAIVNIQNRILDAALAILWSEAQKVKKDGKGLNPDDVINTVQRARVLVCNVHFVYINDKRKTNGYYQSVLT